MTPAIFRCFRLSPHHFISLRNINKRMEIFHKLGSTNYHKLCREVGGGSVAGRVLGPGKGSKVQRRHLENKVGEDVN